MEQGIVCFIIQIALRLLKGYLASGGVSFGFTIQDAADSAMKNKQDLMKFL